MTYDDDMTITYDDDVTQGQVAAVSETILNHCISEYCFTKPWNNRQETKESVTTKNE